MSERDAIVAWLREKARRDIEGACHCRSGNAGRNLRAYGQRRMDDALAIERGGHLPDAHSPVDEVARLREALEAAEYLIDRLDAVAKNQVVRDLCEARGAYQAARKALDTHPAPQTAHD